MSGRDERKITNVDEQVRHYRCHIRIESGAMVSIGFQAWSMADISYWLGRMGFRDIVSINITQYEEAGIPIPNPWPFSKIEDIVR